MGLASAITEQHRAVDSPLSDPPTHPASSWATWGLAKRLTPTHDVVSEEGGPEPHGQHHQVGVDAWEERGEACALSAQVQKGSRRQDSVGVEACDVVPGRVQLSCLDQLRRQQTGGEQRILALLRACVSLGL